jgi:hypothetical protein
MELRKGPTRSEEEKQYCVLSKGNQEDTPYRTTLPLFSSWLQLGAHDNTMLCQPKLCMTIGKIIIITNAMANILGNSNMVATQARKVES